MITGIAIFAMIGAFALSMYYRNQRYNLQNLKQDDTKLKLDELSLKRDTEAIKRELAEKQSGLKNMTKEQIEDWWSKNG